MPSLAEITYFEASEDYKSGLASLDGPLAQISKVTGLKQSYVGYEIEEPAVVFWVNDWVTKDARDAFVEKADYAGIAAASRPAFGSQPTVNYVEFENTKAFGAPITELVTFTLKEGEAIAQLEALVQELHQKLVETPQVHGNSWAPIIGKPNVYHGILGWDSVKAHRDTADGGPLREVINRVKLIADLWVVHAALKPFSA